MKLAGLGAAACLALAACAPEQQFHWGNYSAALYAYYADPTQLADYRQTLVEIVREGEPQRRVPPGIYAELGYLELQAGNEAEAKRYFELEKTRWPESSVFMDRMMAAMGGQAPAAAGAAPAGAAGSIPPAGS